MLIRHRGRILGFLVVTSFRVLSMLQHWFQLAQESQIDLQFRQIDVFDINIRQLFCRLHEGFHNAFCRIKDIFDNIAARLAFLAFACRRWTDFGGKSLYGIDQTMTQGNGEN